VLDPEHPINWAGQSEATTGFHWYEDSTPPPPDGTGVGGPMDAYTDVRLRSTGFGRTEDRPFGSRLASSTRIAQPGRLPAGPGGQGLLLQFRFTNNVEVQAILHALSKTEAGRLLLAPRITMYNNQRAHIVVARQRAYIADYDISGGVYDPVIRTILTGSVLDVKPTVSHDRRYITLELRPGTADRLQFETQDIIILGWADLPIQLPSLQLRSVRTSCTLPDGGTLLLSGLMSDFRFDANSGIPLLSDLPVIGRLFGTDVKQREKANLLIMVTARLILFTEEEAKL
jgi:type II secretory pathway component GspD/PulD (secretin)